MRLRLYRGLIRVSALPDKIKAIKMAKEFFSQRTVVLAHRGMPCTYPENTIIGFRAALDNGADVLETDIHFTKDKKFVVIHDDALERTTDGRGKAGDHPLSELKTLDAGYHFTTDGGQTYPFRGKGLRLPCLEELLKEFPDKRFNIDLKDDNPGQVKYYAEAIKKLKAENRVLTASRYHGNIKELRKIIPEAATALSLREIIFFLIAASLRLLCLIRIRGDAFQIPEYYKRIRIAKEFFIKKARSKKLDVHVWTINDRDKMKRLLEMGADGLFTELPGVLNEVIEECRG